MLSVDIEKEIQQKNKVFLGLTMRQSICIVFAVVCAVLIYMALPSAYSIYPSFAIGGIYFMFGWYHKDGLTAEKYIFKLLREKFYKNNKRKYRTKNRYITLMNNEYRRHEGIDRGNKRIAKQIKKEQNKNKRRTKRTKIKAIS